jgi:hypothetical protein
MTMTNTARHAGSPHIHTQQPCCFDVVLLTENIAGGLLTCQLNITNAGNSSLQNTSVLEHPECTPAANLAPGATTKCSISWPVSQDSFDSWDAQYAYMASGGVGMSAAVTALSGGNQLGILGFTSVKVPLTSQPSMNVTTSSCDPYGSTMYCYPGMTTSPGKM